MAKKRKRVIRPPFRVDPGPTPPTVAALDVAGYLRRRRRRKR